MANLCIRTVTEATGVLSKIRCLCKAFKMGSWQHACRWHRQDTRNGHLSLLLAGPAWFSRTTQTLPYLHKTSSSAPPTAADPQLQLPTFPLSCRSALILRTGRNVRAVRRADLLQSFGAADPWAVGRAPSQPHTTLRTRSLSLQGL